MKDEWREMSGEGWMVSDELVGMRGEGLGMMDEDDDHEHEQDHLLKIIKN